MCIPNPYISKGKYKFQTKLRPQKKLFSKTTAVIIPIKVMSFTFPTRQKQLSRMQFGEVL